MHVPELADHFWLSSSLKKGFDNWINVFSGTSVCKGWIYIIEILISNLLRKTHKFHKCFKIELQQNGMQLSCKMIWNLIGVKTATFSNGICFVQTEAALGLK